LPIKLPPILSGQSSQAEFSRQYSSLMARRLAAKSSLAQLERSQAGSGTELPDEVRAARGRLDAQLTGGRNRDGSRATTAKPSKACMPQKTR